MMLSYKKFESGNIFFVTEPFNGYRLGVFYKKVKDHLKPKKLKNNSFASVFSGFDRIELAENDKKELGLICENISDLGWDPDTYQGETDDIVLDSITKFCKKILKNNI